MPIGQLGMMLAGAGLGEILAPINDRRQLRQQEKLQQLQMQGNKEMTDYNTRKQMEMWENTSYPAQMAMLKKAGLNPALMYGMGGGGGTTANIAQGNVSGADAPKGGGEIIGLMGMAQQSQMLQAQIELTKAQTEKTKAETGNVPLTGENIKATTANISIDTELKKLEQAFQESTFKNRESMINLSLSKLIEEVKIIENDRQISDQTKTQQIKEVYNRVANIAADTLQKQASEAKSRKEIEEINAKIDLLKQAWNINSIDEELAKSGINPNVKLMKLGGSLWNLIKEIF